MHKKAELVQQRLHELGATGTVREFPDGTRTAVQAAEAIGTSVAQVWAAAGTPNTVFPITPDELVRVTGGEVTGGEVADVRQELPQQQPA